jgi:cyanophycinase-like exopeptidase
VADSSTDALVPTPDANVLPSAAFMIFPRRGATADDTGPTAGPGLVLDGGYNAPKVLESMHALAVGANKSRGDLVILTSTAGDASSDVWLLAGFASVQTLALLDGATPSDFALAGQILGNAEAVWLTGGDQAKYVRWQNTPLTTGITNVYARGGSVGGTSAGMIVLGQFVNDALNTISENITTQLAVADPYDQRMHFTRELVQLPPLLRCITDPHFIARDRMGRLATFMARQVQDGFAQPDMLGIGVDDGAALAIDKNGVGTRLGEAGTGAIYVVRGASPTRAVPKAPLRYAGLHLVKLARAEHRYDFSRRCGRGFARDFDLDGDQQPPYPGNVYDDGVELDGCADAGP